ncbi:MAG: sigma-70 family RNA polymerase sigma factor [Chloroflexia bacterium]|nr:sigma-70 family RNA polymerase sigma factor [Chloroflexia bacterium]
MRDPDRMLYRKIQRRDSRALEELIRRYSQRLLDLIRRILGGLGSLEDAEEVLADTFCIVWYHINEYDPQRAPLATWMWMRAKYAALDRRRELRRRRDTVPLVEERKPPRSQVVEAVDNAERWDIAQVLLNLPALERELVYRRYFLQETLGEIAAQVGLSIHAVRNRLWRTRKLLRASILVGSKRDGPAEEQAHTLAVGQVEGSRSAT